MAYFGALAFILGTLAVVSAKSDLWTSSKDFSNFNVVKNLWNTINVTDDPAGGLLNFDKAINVDFPRGTYAAKEGPNGKPSGLAFYAKPGPNIFNRDSVALNYKVYFPKNFEWAKGGKLPGLYSKFGQSGGNQDDSTGFSYRVMWRAGGQAEAYVYAPNKQDTASIERLPGYFADGSIGTSIGRGMQNFLADQWNTVKVFMKLNSVRDGRPIADGIIQLSINGKPAVDFNKMIWRNKADVQIEGVMFQTFFGGNDVSFAPLKDTFIAFKSFSLTEN